MTQLVAFETAGAQIELKLDGDTLWITQQQMAGLFAVQKAAISRHLKNIYASGELTVAATVSKMETVQDEGGRRVVRQLEHYNLDAIISVGYRVNSLHATRFRQWATGVLREHLLNHGARMPPAGDAPAQQVLTVVELLGKTLVHQQLVNDLGQAAVSLVQRYARTWRLLLDYDEDRLQLPEDTPIANGVLSYAAARQALTALKQELIHKGEATALFALERGEQLQALLGSIEQTMFGEPLYRTAAERAAHLLYFVIKDHPFADGNKRCGAFLFLLYLRQEGIGLPIDELGLTALTLLIAESDANAKPLMTRLVATLLTSRAVS